MTFGSTNLRILLGVLLFWKMTNPTKNLVPEVRMAVPCFKTSFTYLLAMTAMQGWETCGVYPFVTRKTRNGRRWSVLAKVLLPFVIFLSRYWMISCTSLVAKWVRKLPILCSVFISHPTLGRGFALNRWFVTHWNHHLEDTDIRCVLMRIHSSFLGVQPMPFSPTPFIDTILIVKTGRLFKWPWVQLFPRADSFTRLQFVNHSCTSLEVRPMTTTDQGKFLGYLCQLFLQTPCKYLFLFKLFTSYLTC